MSGKDSLCSDFIEIEIVVNKLEKLAPWRQVDGRFKKSHIGVNGDLLYVLAIWATSQLYSSINWIRHDLPLEQLPKAGKGRHETLNTSNITRSTWQSQRLGPEVHGQKEMWRRDNESFLVPG